MISERAEVILEIQEDGGPFRASEIVNERITATYTRCVYGLLLFLCSLSPLQNRYCALHCVQLNWLLVICLSTLIFGVGRIFETLDEHKNCI